MAQIAGDQAEGVQVGQMVIVERASPQRSVAGEVDGEQQGVVTQVSPCARVFLGGEEYTAGPHESRGDELDDLGHIAEKYAERGKQPRGTHGQQDEGRDDDRQPKNTPADTAAKEQQTEQHQAEADEHVEERPTDTGHGQDFQGKDHFLHEIGVADNDRGRVPQHFGKKLKQSQAEENPDAEIDLGFIGQHAEFATEDIAKNQHIESKHEQRVKDGPDQTEMAALVTQLHISLGKLPEQLAVAPQVRGEGEGGTAEFDFILTHTVKT